MADIAQTYGAIADSEDVEDVYNLQGINQRNYYKWVMLDRASR